MLQTKTSHLEKNEFGHYFISLTICSLQYNICLGCDMSYTNFLYAISVSNDDSTGVIPLY